MRQIIPHLFILLFFLTVSPSIAQEEHTCSEQNILIEKKLRGELRRIHHEIAALRAELAKPGVTEVLGGIGYIFGIFGTACYIASKKNRQQ